MLIFRGSLADGSKIELFQHYTQLSLLLMSLPKQDAEARRIGFHLVERVKS
jgi:hypothetical protein